jgi:hypothetical protein
MPLSPAPPAAAMIMRARLFTSTFRRNKRGESSALTFFGVPLSSLVNGLISQITSHSRHAFFSNFWGLKCPGDQHNQTTSTPDKQTRPLKTTPRPRHAPLNRIPGRETSTRSYKTQVQGLVACSFPPSNNHPSLQATTTFSLLSPPPLHSLQCRCELGLKAELAHTHTHNQAEPSSA